MGPKADEGRIPGIDVALADGETWQFGSLTMHVFDTPGHTRGHITLWFPEADALFPGGHVRQHCFTINKCTSSLHCGTLKYAASHGGEPLTTLLQK